MSLPKIYFFVGPGRYCSGGTKIEFKVLSSSLVFLATCQLNYSYLINLSNYRFFLMLTSRNVSNYLAASVRPPPPSLCSHMYISYSPPTAQYILSNSVNYSWIPFNRMLQFKKDAQRNFVAKSITFRGATPGPWCIIDHDMVLLE